MIGSSQAARARHILHHDVWLARDMPAEMARHQPAIDVIAAAGSITDDQAHLPAAIKVRNRISARGLRREHQRCHHCGPVKHPVLPRANYRLCCNGARLYTEVIGGGGPAAKNKNTPTPPPTGGYWK